MDATYILPIRATSPWPDDELTAYLRWLAEWMEVIVVDGSTPEVFAAHHRRWGGFTRHIAPDPDLTWANGKVNGVMTGVRHARHERLALGDDDVRYDAPALERLVALLDAAEVVRPQNYFAPLPWHARWDTARTLVNRALDGDWPGTLAVRRGALLATGGYDGDALFENLELVRTVRAAGGREAVPLDLYVRRLPPSAGHFWSQRVRQAYDEFARPLRLGVFLALLPLTLALAVGRRWAALGGLALAAMGLAERGRRRAGGARVFPASASLLAPLWLLERGIAAWLALGARLRFGGVRYAGTTLRKAANSPATLRARHGADLASFQAGMQKRRRAFAGRDRPREAASVSGARTA